MLQKFVTTELIINGNIEFRHPLHVVISSASYDKYLRDNTDENNTTEDDFIGVLLDDKNSPFENTFVSVSLNYDLNYADLESEILQIYVTSKFCKHYVLSVDNTYLFRRIKYFPISKVIFTTTSESTYEFCKKKKFNINLSKAILQKKALCRVGDPFLVALDFYGKENGHLLLDLHTIHCEPIQQGMLQFNTELIITKSNKKFQTSPEVVNLEELIVPMKDMELQAEKVNVLPSYNLVLKLAIMPKLTRAFDKELFNLEPEVDEFNAIFVPRAALANFSSKPGDWLTIKINKTSRQNRKTNVVTARHAMLAVLPETVDYSMDQTACGSPQLWFNLNEHPSYLLQPSCEVYIESSTTTPPFAKEIHVTLVQSPECDGVTDCQSLLMKYFKIPRYVCKGDIICANSETDPVFQIKNREIFNSRWPIVYFRVSTIEGDESFYGYLCDQEHTRLYQVGTSQCYVPLTMQYFLSQRKCLPYFESPCPRGLQVYIEKMQDLIYPVLQAKKLAVATNILVSGPANCGKSTVIKATCKRLNLHLYEIDCRKLFGDTSAAIEAKLKIKLDKAGTYTPCMAVLKHIDYVAREKELKGTNSRVLATLIELLKEINTTDREWPMVLVATTRHIKHLNPELASVFLLRIHMEAPSQDERTEMLEELLQPFPIANNFSKNYISQRTAGFLLKDYMMLLHEIVMVQFEKALSLLGEKSDSFLEEDLQLAIVSISQQDLMKAVEKLQTDTKISSGVPKIPNVQWEDVGGLEDVKKEILDTIQLPLEHPEILMTGLRRSGVLLYGPPGTGKTLIAKAVATECALNFISVKGPELINMYVGQSEENVRNVFEQARNAVPCIVFFDELDSLAPNRGKSGDSGGVMDRVVSQLLAELDGLGSSAQVYVIGATNRIELLDPALLRPGRFDRQVYVGIPQDKESKLSILKALSRKIPLHRNVDLGEIAEKCPVNVSGADLYSLCSNAVMRRVEINVNLIENECENKDDISELIQHKDFEKALESLVPSVSEKEAKKYHQNI